MAPGRRRRVWQALWAHVDPIPLGGARYRASARIHAKQCGERFRTVLVGPPYFGACFEQFWFLPSQIVVGSTNAALYSTKHGQRHLDLSDFPPNSGVFRNTVASVAQLSAFSANFRRCSTKFGLLRPTPGLFRRNLTNTGQDGADSGQLWATFGQLWPVTTTSGFTTIDFATCLAHSVLIWLRFHQVWLISTNFASALTQRGLVSPN